ncbi:hypothetical protein [Mesorhizobium sp. M0296]|uniref:hypothetical protein n=1 Tax=Mesorhizobium sp. M0296 TaxID=2956931 RepID=UPI00333C5806
MSLIEADSRRMNMDGPALLIPTAALPGFTDTTRNELLAYVGLIASSMVAPPTDARLPTPRALPAIEDGPADLTVAMARKLIAEPISAKSTAALRVIAESDTPEFHMKDAIAAAPETENYLDLRGAWSGITRRARKILGDSTADLVWWEGEQIYDDEENYVDHIGRVSSLTHQSLRAAFGIRGTD